MTMEVSIVDLRVVLSSNRMPCLSQAMSWEWSWAATAQKNMREKQWIFLIITGFVVRCVAFHSRPSPSKKHSTQAPSIKMKLIFLSISLFYVVESWTGNLCVKSVIKMNSRAVLLPFICFFNSTFSHFRNWKRWECEKENLRGREMRLLIID